MLRATFLVFLLSMVITAKDCDINLGNLRHILHDSSSCCNSPGPIRFDTFSTSTATTLQTSLSSHSSKTTRYIGQPWRPVARSEPLITAAPTAMV